MDSLDHDLIAALRRNGRESIANLAVDLNCSRATVRSRMDRLTSSGVITGFSVTLREEGLANPVRGMMMIKIAGHKTERIIARIHRISAVQSVYSTNGKWDLIVELATGDLLSFDAALGQMRKIEGIAESETNILLATKGAQPLGATA